jgi:hypothetical protein
MVKPLQRESCASQLLRSPKELGGVKLVVPGLLLWATAKGGAAGKFKSL